MGPPVVEEQSNPCGQEANVGNSQQSEPQGTPGADPNSRCLTARCWLSVHQVHTPGFSAKLLVCFIHQVGKVINYLCKGTKEAWLMLQNTLVHIPVSELWWSFPLVILPSALSEEARNSCVFFENCHSDSKMVGNSSGKGKKPVYNHSRRQRRDVKSSRERKHVYGQPTCHSS